MRKPHTRFLYCAVFCCLIRMLSRAARIGSECVGNLGGWMLGAGVEIGTAPLCFSLPAKHCIDSCRGPHEPKSCGTTPGRKTKARRGPELAVDRSPQRTRARRAPELAVDRSAPRAGRSMTEGPLRTKARCGPRTCTEACTTATWQRTGARCIAASPAQRATPACRLSFCRLSLDRFFGW